MTNHISRRESNHVGNVMTPLNYGSIIFEGFMAAMGVFAQNNIIQYGSFLMCILWALFYVYVYTYFMRRDPDRLQTESFNLENKAMVLGRLTHLSPKLEEKQALQNVLTAGTVSTDERKEVP